MEIAEELGREIAKSNAILITGGMSGVMEAASCGAYEAGGITVGTPGRKRNMANPWVAIEICTPIDTGDYIFAGVLSCDAIIVLPGNAGTLAETLIAYRYKKPLIFIKEFNDNILQKLQLSNKRSDSYFIVNSVKEAITLSIKLADKAL